MCTNNIRLNVFRQLDLNNVQTIAVVCRRPVTAKCVQYSNVNVAIYQHAIVLCLLLVFDFQHHM